MTQEKLKTCPGSAAGAKKHLPLQLVNNLFEAIIINSNTIYGYSPLGMFEMFLEDHFRNEASCRVRFGRSEVY